MEQMEAVRELHKLGVVDWGQVENFTCGSEHDPVLARSILDLAEIAWPGKLAASMLEAPQP